MFQSTTVTNRNLRFHTFSLCMAVFATLASFSASALTPEELKKARQLLQFGAEKVKEAYGRVQGKAQANVQAALGQQADCRETGAALDERREEFLLAARLSRDIYNRAEGRIKRRPGEDERKEIEQDGQRITLWFDPASDGYAEVHHDALDGAEVVVFRGTQITHVRDLTTNLGQFVNIVPERYQWAAWLLDQTAGEAPGKRLLAVGHSLGGGLAAYAALAHGAEAVTFNPAGLSRGALATLPGSAPEASGRKIVTFIACSGKTLDPVSALSLAGDGMIAGRRYLVDREPGLAPLQIHNMGGFTRDLAARAEAESLTRCANDLGLQGSTRR
jgi:hypothetical protein